jgi:hypothetical protein
VDQLQDAITSTIEAIPKTQSIQVFQTWGWRPERCIQEEGNYSEQTEFDPTNSISFESWEVGQSGHLMDTLYMSQNHVITSIENGSADELAIQGVT